MHVNSSDIPVTVQFTALVLEHSFTFSPCHLLLSYLTMYFYSLPYSTSIPQITGTRNHLPFLYHTIFYFHTLPSSTAIYLTIFYCHTLTFSIVIPPIFYFHALPFSTFITHRLLLSYLAIFCFHTLSSSTFITLKSSTIIPHHLLISCHVSDVTIYFHALPSSTFIPWHLLQYHSHLWMRYLTIFYHTVIYCHT